MEVSDVVFIVSVEGRMTSGGAGGMLDGSGGAGGGDCSMKSAGGGGKLSNSEIVANVGMPIFAGNGGGRGGGGGGGGGGLAAGLDIICLIGGFGSNWDIIDGSGGGGGACRVMIGD